MDYSGAKSTFDLLSMPAEIRAVILHHALVISSAIRLQRHVTWSKGYPSMAAIQSKPSWQQWSRGPRPAGQILRTCRQIYSEGIDMLYRDNVFAIDLLVTDEPALDRRFDFLGFESLAAAFESFPHLKHASRFAVMANVGPCFDTLRGQPQRLRLVEQTVEQIRVSCPARMAHFELRLEPGRDCRSDWSGGRMPLLHDFGHLRAEHATFTGLTGRYRDRLVSIIESHKPVRRLRDESEMIAEYVRNNCQWRSCGARMAYPSCLLIALDEWDDDVFSSLRDAVDLLAAAPSLKEFIVLLDGLDHCRRKDKPWLYRALLGSVFPP